MGQTLHKVHFKIAPTEKSPFDHDFNETQLFQHFEVAILELWFLKIIERRNIKISKVRYYI